MISIVGLDKAQVLVALYNRSWVRGMGALNAKKTPFTVDEARVTLESNKSKYFDYLYGRVMKVSLAGNEIDERLYDRDLGFGACAEAIDSIREK